MDIKLTLLKEDFNLEFITDNLWEKTTNGAVYLVGDLDTIIVTIKNQIYCLPFDDLPNFSNFDEFCNLLDNVVTYLKYLDFQDKHQLKLF